jgi:hypothetical protein
VADGAHLGAGLPTAGSTAIRSSTRAGGADRVEECARMRFDLLQMDAPLPQPGPRSTSTCRQRVAIT